MVFVEDDQGIGKGIGRLAKASAEADLTPATLRPRC
jgi:hypothetical protein